MSKRWSKADMLAKHQDKEAREAMKKAQTHHYKVKSCVTGRPTMGSMVKYAEDSNNMQLTLECSRTLTRLEIDIWNNRSVLEGAGAPPQPWVTIRMYSMAAQQDPLWENNAGKCVVYEGPLHAGKANEARFNWAETIVNAVSHHALAATTPDDPFYIEDEEENVTSDVAWDDRW